MRVVSRLVLSAMAVAVYVLAIRPFGDWRLDAAFWLAVLMAWPLAGRWLEGRGESPEKHLRLHRERMERELAEKSQLEDLGRMAATVAHNVKNPLSSMRTLMQLWGEAENLSEEQRQEVAMMIREVDHLSETVTSLLKFSRLEEGGGGRLKVGEASLEGVLERVRSLFQPQADARGLILECEAKPAGAVVRSDAGALSDILVNLVGNAMEACGEGDKILLQGGVGPGGWWVRVRDNGKGIPPAIRPQLFEPFVSDKSKGTGLGLAIVKKQAEQLGGGIEVEDTAEGASFLLKFEEARDEDTDRG